MLRGSKRTILATLAAVVLMTGLVAAVPHDIWRWTIVKTGDASEVTLAAGQSLVVTYTVQVTATRADSLEGGIFDECITLTDDQAPESSSWLPICVPFATEGAGTSPWTGYRTYSRTISFEQCGEYSVRNVATFVTNDTFASGSDDHVVVVHVPCEGGCTLTPGYWTTHSSYGPAPYDDTWALVGEDTAFFSSGSSYHRVLWTPPQGNAYYILARAFIAAQLNQLNGAASTAAVDSAMAWAAVFFSSHTPASTLSRAERATVISYAALLDQYNNGDVGPGHCSEDSSSK